VTIHEPVRKEKSAVARRSTTEPGVLHDRQFVRYLVARGLSGIGSVATLIALPVLVYRTSGDPGLTALVAGLEAAPYLLFGLFSGALTDRWNRKRVMVTADVASTLLLATIPLAAWTGEVTVPHVLAVAFLGPTIGVFFDGAVFGAIPVLVGRSRIAEANSIAWSLQSIVEIAVPAAAGALLAVLDPAWLLGVDALTFAVSATLIAGIGRPMYDPTRERAPLGVRQILRDIGEGLRYLVHHPGVRTMTVIGFLQCLAGGAFVALMVVWTDRQLGIGTEGLRFGLVYGSWAIGSLAASLMLPSLLRVTFPSRITLVALPISAALGLLVPLLENWVAGAAALAVWSVAYTMVTINSISYRQVVTPEHLLGRVNTAGRMLSWGLGWTGGALVAGILVGWLGTVGTMELLAVAPVVGVVVAWTSPLRNQREHAAVAGAS
jgi:MFS family permease